MYLDKLRQFDIDDAHTILTSNRDVLTINKLQAAIATLRINLSLRQHIRLVGFIVVQIQAVLIQHHYAGL